MSSRRTVENGFVEPIESIRAASVLRRGAFNPSGRHSRRSIETSAAGPANVATGSREGLASDAGVCLRCGASGCIAEDELEQLIATACESDRRMTPSGEHPAAPDLAMLRMLSRAAPRRGRERTVIAKLTLKAQLASEGHPSGGATGKTRDWTFAWNPVVEPR